MVKLKEIPDKIRNFIKFITIDVWRITDSEVSKHRRRYYNFVKVIVLVVRRFSEDKLGSKASALTYSTLLSLVPLLAILLSIAKGFGFSNIVESQLFEHFEGHREILARAFNFVNSYMEQTKEGLFVGLGIVLLLYTVINLISSIENILNEIWMVKKGRTIYRQITDYLSVFLILPIFLVCTSGLSLFISTSINNIEAYELIAPIYQTLLKVIPLTVSILAFTLLFMFMPNTKVKFLNALYGGIFSGISFMVFQYLYINGQIWVSKYNAIYGSFAFLPLLMLWLQLSWLLCLIGSEISYASQNISSYDFEDDSKEISRRYYDFVLITIAAIIIKRFEKGERPYTADEISADNKIPIRLAHRIIYDLKELDIINEVKEIVDDDDRETYYQPALDINKITVGYILNKKDTKGSEEFKIDKKQKFKNEWGIILKSRKDMFLNNDTLLKDL